MKEKGILIGTSSFDNMIVFNQKEAYIQSGYVVIIDSNKNKYLGEIIDCYIEPYLHRGNLPQGIDITFFDKHTEYDINKTSYFAKIKILNTALTSNIEPTSKIYEPSFEDLKNILFQTEVNEGFNLGIINGTEYLQNTLPKEIQNITPLLKRDEETKEYHSVKQEGIPYIYNYRSMAQNPHIGLFGSSGSGKSQAMKVIQEECAIKGIPYLCFDPHNELSFNDFRSEVEEINPSLKRDFKNHNEIFYIGKDVGICFEKLNVRTLTNLFGFFEGGLTDSQKNVLQILYEEGMSLKHLKYKAETLVSALNKTNMKYKINTDDFEGDELAYLNEYGNKVGGLETVRAFSWRLNTLESKGIFAHDIDKVVNCIKKRKGAIIRGNMEHLRVVGYYLMSELYQLRICYKEYNGDTIPPFLIFVDEAHNFAPEGQSSLPTKTFLRTLALESRKYGVFLCLATQRPANLDKTLLTQINNKFIFRIVDSNDIMALKTECNLSHREISYLPNLKAGNCYLVLASQEKKFFIRFRCTFTLDSKGDNPFDELKKEELSEIEMELIKFDNINRSLHSNILNELENKGHMIDISKLLTYCDILVEKGFFVKENSPMGYRYLNTKKEIH